MPELRPARLGIVGAGYIARIHVRAAQPLTGQLDICAIADANHAAARSLVELQGHGTAYSDLTTMLAAEGLDGVLIATWPSNHLELIQRCVEAGVPYILCEKPFVLTGAQALDVWQLAARTGAVVTEAFMYRHHPALDRVDAILTSGELGAVDHVRASFTYVNRSVDLFAPGDPHRPWRLQAELGGGALYDIGAYTVNACTHVAASVPTRVAALGRSRNAYGTNDQVHALVEYANGVVGMLQSTETADSTQQLEVYGEQASLFLPYTWTIYDETELTVRRSVDPVHIDPDRHFRTLVDRFTIPRSNAFTDQLRNAAAVMRGDAAPRISLAETVVNTIAIDAIARSHAEREVIEVVIPDDVAAAHLGDQCPLNGEAHPTDAGETDEPKLRSLYP